MAEFTRRQFLVGCSAAIAAMAGSRLTSVVMGNPLSEPNQEIMVTIFIRGGWDALNIIPPLDGADRGFYEAARSSIQVPANFSYQLGTSNFFFHPAAERLYDLYNSSNLAAIQATGMFISNRSHFDSMSFMELGTPGSKVGSSGWLARHLESANIFGGPGEQASLATGNLSPTSLLGYLDTLTLSNPNGFTLNIGPSQWRDEQRQALTSIYGGDSQIEITGSSAIASLEIVENNLLGGYTPEPGVVYPGGGYGRDLQTIARLIK
nr:twin-arginine translocation signal domain-containing protein [Candidatus Dadabacteria bacterium]